VGVHGVGAVPRAFAWVWCRSENSRRYRLATAAHASFSCRPGPSRTQGLTVQLSSGFTAGPPGWRRRFRRGLR
jgi:hypothetical protein